MAGDSHENRGGDASVEENIVGTRIRHVSCEEEPPLHSSSSPAPCGAAARRFSLPTALPAPQGSLAAPVPEYSQAPRDTVLPVDTIAAPSASWYPSCPHRGHVWEGGPPCYLCSVLDAPPKYRRREKQGWHTLKEKLAQLSHATLSPVHVARPQVRSPPPAVFTISEWRPGAATTGGVPASLNASPVQERDNPAFDAQDSVGDDGAPGPSSGVPPHLPSTSVAVNTGVSFVSLPSPRTSSAIRHMAPPPYSPPSATDAHMPPFVPHQNVSQAAPSSKCNRRLVCQILYSLLLATASSTLIVSYDQPILVITSVIVFLTLFVFLPIIAILECLFRCKMEQDFRHYLHNLITTSAPSVTPLVF